MKKKNIITDMHNTDNQIWAQIVEDIGIFFFFFFFIYNKSQYHK